MTVNAYKYVSKLYGLTVHSYGVLQKRLLKSHAMPPLSARILLTYRCNCTCHFCNAHFPGKEEMNVEDLDKILKQIPAASSLTFSGGEITLLKDFLPMMKQATRRHNVQIVTSGSTLHNNKGMIKELIDYGVWVITFSIDVPNSIHDKLRGPSGLLERIIEAIKEIREIRKQKRLIKPLVHVNSVILKESLPFLPEMVKFCIETGVDYLSFGGLDSINFDENDWNCFREKLPLAMDIDKKSRFPVTLTAEVRTAYDALNNAPKDRVSMSHFACYAPWSVLIIEPDGMAHICRDGVSHGMGVSYGKDTACLGMKEYGPSLGTLGNIKNTSLKELWNSRTAQNWRKTIIGLKELPPSCLSCCLISRVK